MKCTLCGKPIVLVPSAEERSRKCGEPAEFYSSLFTEHAGCALAKRKSDTSELIQRLARKGAK